MYKNDNRPSSSHPYLDSNIVDVLNRKAFRFNCPSIISCDGVLFRHDGNNWINGGEFDLLYPELHLRKNNWRNYDKTKNYLHGEQSY